MSHKTIDQIRDYMKAIARPVRLMEVCGTHTVAIFRHGIRSVLPDGITLLSGPGCPVCVTSIHDVETALAIASLKHTVLTTFGDMMRVPGIAKSLFHAKAEGADIRVVYSPLDALQIAAQEKEKDVVFFATGFETTSPSVAMTVLEAERRKILNFYIFSVHKTVPPAIRALLDSGEVQIDGFILPGHVSTIIGTRPYDFISSRYQTPSAITGFEAQDILEGIAGILGGIVSGKASVENQYKRVVREEGNPRAISVLHECFQASDASWRGLGTIPGSGLELQYALGHRDIRSRYELNAPEGEEPAGCSCGEVLKGVKLPTECRLFGRVCIPDRPVGACMVSAEGSCAAYYKYQDIGQGI